MLKLRDLNQKVQSLVIKSFSHFNEIELTRREILDLKASTVEYQIFNPKNHSDEAELRSFFEYYGGTGHCVSGCCPNPDGSWNCIIQDDVFIWTENEIKKQLDDKVYFICILDDKGFRRGILGERNIVNSLKFNKKIKGLFINHVM